jgi:hypothetical protein
MTVTNEQIQALKAAENITEQLPAALEAWEKSNQGSVTLGWIHAANPVAVESLLAERDADKKLIAESVVLFETLRQRIAELEQKHCGGALMEREQHHVGVVNKLLEHIAELEARTLTVKLPEYYDMLWQRNPGGSYETVEAISVMKIKAMLIDAGITLVVGE